MNLQNIQAAESAHVLTTYKRQPVAFVRGEGSRLYDVDGREYLDLLSGIGVAALGHAHPRLAAALAEQAQTLLHTSNLFYHPLQAQVADRLATLSGLPRVFFCNSGTEAVEACLKFARRYWYTKGEIGRTGFVAFTHGFSGRTLGSLSVTWEPNYRAPFQPLVPGVTFVEVGDVDALNAAVTASTATIIAEPIQGEGGVRPMPQAFADAIESACTRTGTLLIADEIQCGLGRTGRNFYFQALGLTPDLVSTAKALGAGVPVGATLVAAHVADAVAPGDHGTTYGGNLLACRAALVFLEELMDNGLLPHVIEAGAVFELGLRTLALKYPVITEVRGAGLMWGLQLTVDAAPVVASALKHGLIINRTNEKVVRMLPPYTITREEIARALSLLDTAFAEAYAEVTA